MARTMKDKNLLTLGFRAEQCHVSHFAYRIELRVGQQMLEHFRLNFQ